MQVNLCITKKDQINLILIGLGKASFFSSLSEYLLFKSSRFFSIQAPFWFSSVEFFYSFKSLFNVISITNGPVLKLLNIA